MTLCACGAPATSGSSHDECPGCFRDRIRSVRSGFAPTRSLGAGQMDPAKTHTFENRLDDFRSVAAEGSVPRTTRRDAIEEAKRVSDQTGEAFRADRASLEFDRA